jgi:hypothetical protein
MRYAAPWPARSNRATPRVRAACPPTDTGNRKNSHGTSTPDDEHAEPLAVTIGT